MNISVQVNGEAREVPANTTVAEFARLLELPDEGVAIAIDDDVVVAGRWHDTVLREGARIDVLTAVQGG